MSISRILRIIPLRLRSVFRRNAVEQDLDDELQYHIEQQTAQNIRAGMTPEQAHNAAIRSFGGLELRKAQARDARKTRWLDETPRDIAFAVRSLKRVPGFTTAVVLTLALGIGANNAMFTLLRGTLLKPLPNRDGESLVYLRQSAQEARLSNTQFSVPEVNDYRTAMTTLSDLAEYSSMLYTLVGLDGRPVRARIGIVSGNYFEVMGLEPVLGRLTTSRDDGPAASPVAIIAHHYWLEHFGGDSSIIGRTIRVNDKVATIHGVLQPAPHYPRRTDVFTNTVTSPHHLSATMVTGRTHRMSELFGRVAPGQTVDNVRKEISGIASRMFREHPEAYEKAAQFTVTVSPLQDAVNERATLTFWLLMGAAAFVLLIACANVANLTLMRGVGREREMLVRAALGAGSGRLRRLLIVENLTLALIGGAIGVLVAYAGLQLLTGFAAQLSPRAHEIRIDGVVLMVGFATSVVAAVVLSFVPHIGGERGLGGTHSYASRRTTAVRGRVRFQHSLVMTQLAVCVVLLTGAGLLGRTLTKLLSVDTGVRAEHVLTMDLPIDGPMEDAFMRQAELAASYQRMRDIVDALPGVEVAAVGSQTPLRTASIAFDVKAEGKAVAPDEPTPNAAMRTADPRYFSAAGIPLIAGRAFTDNDSRGAAAVVILNESLATRLFGSENPIGRRVAWTGDILKFTPISPDWRTVVGVVGDTRDGELESAPVPAMFEPFSQEAIIGASLLVRTRNDPALVQAAILRTIRENFPRQIIERVATLEQIRADRVAPRKLNALFIASFGGLAMIIAMVGIAGVLAFSVSSRTSEIGIRMSFGADAGRVQRMILREGGVLLLGGLAIGVVGALAATRLLSGLLFGVEPHDPATLAMVAGLLATIGLAACWIPAVRAARVDPIVALRSE